MPKRDPQLLLDEIRGALGRIERYLAGVRRVEFLRGRKDHRCSGS
jgi:hypothetical protein